jgi:hypothetical protein
MVQVTPLPLSDTIVERRSVSAAQGAARQAGRGLRQAAGQKQFFLYNSQFYLILFRFLSRFQIVFSIQIFPTKILFRELKSYRNFSIKF